MEATAGVHPALYFDACICPSDWMAPAARAAGWDHSFLNNVSLPTEGHWIRQSLLLNAGWDDVSHLHSLSLISHFLGTTVFSVPGEGEKVFNLFPFCITSWLHLLESDICFASWLGLYSVQSLCKIMNKNLIIYLYFNTSPSSSVLNFSLACLDLVLTNFML